jgi:hypothetical protein
MSKTEINIEEQKLKLEERKVKALEKIALSVDALSIWFEEVDKDEWSSRIEYYLHEYYKKYINGTTNDKDDVNKFNI